MATGLLAGIHENKNSIMVYQEATINWGNTKKARPDV